MSSDFFLNDKILKKLDRQTQNLINKTGLDRKTENEVFDKTTLLKIGDLISNNVIDHFDFPISTGKEAVVFRAVLKNNQYVAIKIYRTSNLAFKHIAKYIDGDPRFNLKNKSRRDILYEWAKKEYKNLEKMEKIKVLAPHPVKKVNNILIMQYIGNSNQSAPMLKDVILKNPKKIFNKIIRFISIMYNKGGIVHADLSPYNILFYKGDPYIIDLGQGILKQHPQSKEFLKRDIHNIVNYFKKYNIDADENKIIRNILKINEGQ